VIGFASMSRSLGKDSEFKNAIMTAHRLGTGLFIWGDNQPLVYHANIVLPEIAGCIITGDNLFVHCSLTERSNTTNAFKTQETTMQIRHSFMVIQTNRDDLTLSISFSL
jgi:hypothetical protein